MNIGFIGLGHMGHPMVVNLLSAKHTVYVYDVMSEAIESLIKEGAVGAQNPKDITQHCDVIFTMLQTGEQVTSVCLGDDGIFHNAKDNTLFIDCSSIAISATRELHQQAEKNNIRMVEAPVSGGVAGAAKAMLTIMVGGSAENFQAAKPLLECVGKNIIHAGPAGSGQAAKICNNMLLGISMIGVCEAFTLGQKLGLDPEKFFEISSQSSGQCWSMTSYCPVPGPVPEAPSNNDYQPGFTAQMMLKDLNLSQDAAQHADAQTPLGTLATELYQQFNDQDNSAIDFSGIIKMLQS